MNTLSHVAQLHRTIGIKRHFKHAQKQPDENTMFPVGA